MRLFDTHAHLSYPPLSEMESEILEKASAAGLEGICAIATNLQSSYACVDIAERNENVFALSLIHI